jgi:hypothetical protein
MRFLLLEAIKPAGCCEASEAAVDSSVLPIPQQAHEPRRWTLG